MSRARQAAATLATLRIGYGLALALAPTRLTRTWLGEGGGSSAARVALRGLGARDVLLHVGVLVTALGDAPVRPWLGAAIAGDLADITATVVDRGGLPARSAPATAAVAGASAALSAVALVAVDR